MISLSEINLPSTKKCRGIFFFFLDLLDIFNYAPCGFNVVLMFLKSFLIISFLCLFNISFQYVIVSSEINCQRFKMLKVMRSLF